MNDSVMRLLEIALGGGGMGLVVALLTLWVQRRRDQETEEQERRRIQNEAEKKLTDFWNGLCDQQQERITQMHGDLTSMTTVVSNLQRELSTGAIDRLDMHEQLQNLETQAIERERRVQALGGQIDIAKNRIIELEQENQALRTLIKGLEAFGDRVAYLEAENAELREQVYALQERIKILEAENNLLRRKAE